MYRRMVGQSLRVGLLVILVVLTLSACGGAHAQGRKIPEDKEGATESHRIPAGKYVTDEFRPAMSFRLNKGWHTGLRPKDSLDGFVETSQSHNITLSTFSESGTSYLEFLVIPKVYKVVSSYEAGTQPAPKDMVSWLQNNPNLDTEKPEPTSVGGVKGKELDAVASQIPQEYISGGYHGCCQTGPSLPLFQVIPAYGTESTYEIYKDDKVRFIVLDDVKGKAVTIAVLTPAVKFDEVWHKAQKVLDSVKWTGS
jgi:hypothetical protein